MNVKTLSRLLKQSHRKTKSWNKTGKDFDITGGLAYKIAIHNYEPAHDYIRNKLSLDTKRCSKCQRRIVNSSIVQNKVIKPYYQVKWDHLTKEERHKVMKEYIDYKEKNGTNNSGHSE